MADPQLKQPEELTPAEKIGRLCDKKLAALNARCSMMTATALRRRGVSESVEMTPAAFLVLQRKIPGEMKGLSSMPIYAVASPVDHTERRVAYYPNRGFYDINPGENENGGDITITSKPVTFVTINPNQNPGADIVFVVAGEYGHHKYGLISGWNDLPDDLPLPYNLPESQDVLSANILCPQEERADAFGDGYEMINPMEGNLRALAQLSFLERTLARQQGESGDYICLDLTVRSNGNTATAEGSYIADLKSVIGLQLELNHIEISHTDKAVIYGAVDQIFDF